MTTILYGHNPNELTQELTPATDQQAWRQYRELITTHYAALIIEGETVAHNLDTGPVISRRSEHESEAKK